jgi:hypothetical protein
LLLVGQLQLQLSHPCLLLLQPLAQHNYLRGVSKSNGYGVTGKTGGAGMGVRLVREVKFCGGRKIKGVRMVVE